MAEHKDISIVNREQCTGCGACKAVCPKQAIVLEPDIEGFPTPQINDECCIHCGLCEKTCPALHPPVRKPIMAAYAAQLKDKEALKDSTSGGLFTAFSREIFHRGGAVFGCVWDADYNAVIVQADNEDEIVPMRGSKYVWSDASDAYPLVKAVLEAGRPVLFTGLPCQAAGLRNYLKKDYNDLYILDFFCGGCPSPMALKAYIHTITKDYPISRIDLKFRDKERDGVGVHISYYQKTGKVYEGYLQNPYFYSYHSKVFHRLPCYHCEYRTGERFEDLTMGDYWGVGNYHEEFDIRAGVSALLVSSEKGRELLDSVRDQLQLSGTRTYNIAAGNNLDIEGLNRKYHTLPFRDDFLRLCSEDRWDEAERKYLVHNKERMMLRMKQNIKDHFPFILKLKRLLRR